MEIPKKILDMGNFICYDEVVEKCEYCNEEYEYGVHAGQGKSNYYCYTHYYEKVKNVRRKKKTD